MDETEYGQVDNVLSIEIQHEVAFTESKGDNNIKPRKCKCPGCLYILMTNLMGPRCKACNSYLITLRISKPINELAR